MSKSKRQTVCVAGLGLLGASLAATLSGSDRYRTVGLARREETIREGRRLGMADHLTSDPVEAFGQADLVVLCTPVPVILETLRTLAPYLKPGATVTDVGSVKAAMVRVAALCPEPLRSRFVGGHPMAGSHLRGMGAARPDLYQNATVILTPDPSTARDALATVSDLWQAVGARIRILSAEEHDRVVALTSHLPHMAAAALARTISVEAYGNRPDSLHGAGLRDTTRVAAADPDLWVDICLANAPDILGALDAFDARMAELRTLLRNGDRARLRAYLQAAAEARGSFEGG